MIRFVLPVLFFLSTAPALQAQPEVGSISSLRFIGEYVVPHNKPFKGTTIGGLSGIDYDPAHNEYYFICDDRSAINPARFYKAKIYFSASKIDSVQFTEIQYLLQEDGRTYPNAKVDPLHTPDPEAIRYNAQLKQLVWTSEGERVFKAKDTILSNPAINIIQPDGKFIGNIAVPPNLEMSRWEKGPRKNGTLEGLSFGEAYRKLYVSVEEPLYDDGDRIGLNNNSVPIRILQFDVASKKNTAQYAYVPDPVAYPSIPANEFKINGVPDVLWIGVNQLLVVERSFSTGRVACTVKIFVADLSKAENIISVPSLKARKTATANKKLIFNMDDLGIYIDNVEGVTLGPSLPNGHKTLILMTDNNFESFEKTQFFLFEVIP